MALTTIPVELVTLDDGVTITVDDNSDNLTLTSTDADANAGPNLRMYRNSSSPADSDALGLIEFEGRNDNTQDVVYAGIDSRIVDASDGTEDGRIEIVAALAGTDSISRILMNSTETVFNDTSADLDFRVESNGNTSALFVDAGNDKVTTGVRLDFADLLIGTGAGKYIQVTGGSSNALAIGMDGGTAAPGTASTSVGFHHWNNSSWSNVMNVTRDGLAFGTDTATANSLDDYEEGTYSPTWTGSSVTGSQGYSYQNGWYVKVGSLVTCFFDMNVTSSSGMSGAGYISLPVASKNQNWYAPIVPWEVATAFTDSDQKAGGYVQPNAAVVVAYKYESENSVLESSGYFNINVTGRISGQVTYQAA